MSAGNWFLTRKGAFEEKTIDLYSANRVTYTVRMGASSDDFIIDRVINWHHLDFYGNIAITVPDGLYEGQRLLINLVSIDTVSDDITVTPETALVTVDYDLTTAGDYCSLEWTNATGGWVYLAEETT